MDAAKDRPTLGMLQLQNTPIRLPGAISNPATFDFPVRYLQVPGAWTKNVVGTDPTVVTAYIESAKQLEREGVAAISTNCGFTARFQKDVAAAVKIPVALSSLSLVPFMSRVIPPGKKLGIITYDAKQLVELHFNGAGWSMKDTPAIIVGIEGSESWTEMAKPDPKFNVEMLERDVLAVTRKLLSANSDVAAIVLECSAFPIVAHTVRREIGLPTVDFSTLQRFLMASVTARAGVSRAAAE